jgi:hypothetical protein
MTKNKIDVSFELARYFENGHKVSITVKQYNDFLIAIDKEKIANMVYHRLHARYLRPFLFEDEIYKGIQERIFDHGELLLADRNTLFI